MRKTLTIALMCVSCTAVFAQSFTEGFENGPADWNDSSTGTFGNSVGGDDVTFDSGTWHFLNASNPIGLSGWFNAADNVVPTHSGLNQAGVNFNNTTGTNTISSYMMSHELTMNDGDVISFWTVTPNNSFPDRLRLKLSTNGASTNASDFNITLLTIDETLSGTYPTTHTQFTAVVSGLGGPTSGRIGFHYDVTGGGPGGNNSNYIAIDDVSYEAVPEPATLTLLGLGAIAAFRRRKA